MADDVLGTLTVSDLEQRARVAESWGKEDAREVVARHALRWAIDELDADEVLALVGELVDADELDE